METKLKFTDLKNREKSILNYLKNNLQLFFDCHAYNGYDNGVLCLNYNLDTIAYDQGESNDDLPDGWPFVSESYGCMISDPEYYFSDYDDETLRDALINAVRYYVATEFAQKGYSHKSLLWALHNCTDEEWFTEIMPNPEKQKTLVNETLLERLKYHKFKKRVEKFVKENPEFSIYRKVTFSNHSGDHGYTDYDLINLKVYGYVVNCWSSHAFGGNCNCINHDPGSYFEYDLDESGFNFIREICEKQHLQNLTINA